MAAAREMSLTQQSAHKNTPKWTISARIPPRECGKGMPGPGAYGNTHTEKDKYSTCPKWSISAGQRDTKEWGAFPGPGQYAPKLAGKTLPMWGFGSESRLHAVKEARGPGPGSYETRGSVGGNSYSVSSRPEGSSKRSTTPAPGHYKPNYDQIFETSGKASFGSSSRSELAMSKTPGPGQYEPLPVLGGSCGVRSMPRYTIAGKRSQPSTDQSPGPGPGATQFSR